MAIIIEEEKNKTGLVTIAAWIIILIIIASAIYYIFFAKPQLIEVSPPAGFENINPLSKINLNPSDVVNNAAFQSLKQYITLPVPGNYGRSNPFVPL
jgi:hypothetical protein